MDAASFDHADISAEVGVAKKFKVLVSHSNGSAVPWKDQKMSLSTWSDSFVICWRRGVLVCGILKCQNDPAEIALQNAVVRTASQDNSEKYAQIFAWQFGSFERWCVSGCSENEQGNFVNKLVDQARSSSGMGIVVQNQIRFLRVTLRFWESLKHVIPRRFATRGEMLTVSQHEQFHAHISC